MDDYADFQRLRRALLSVGLTEKDLSNVFDVVAAVLHLGNTHFVEKMDDSKGLEENYYVATTFPLSTLWNNFILRNKRREMNVFVRHLLVR